MNNVVALRPRLVRELTSAEMRQVSMLIGRHARSMAFGRPDNVEELSWSLADFAGQGIEAALYSGLNVDVPTIPTRQYRTLYLGWLAQFFDARHQLSLREDY